MKEETDAEKAKRMLKNNGDRWTPQELGFKGRSDLHMAMKTIYRNGKFYYCGLEILDDSDIMT